MVRIGRLNYRNIIGVDDLEISPIGKVTELTGKNGAGKSTTINALFALIEGAREATLIPKDGTVGEVVLVVDAPDDSYTFRRTVKEDGLGPLTVKSAKDAPLSKPQDVMRKLINRMGANPVKFINGTEEEQLEWVLKAVPLKVTQEQLSAALGVPVPYDPSIEGHALTVIGSFYKGIYNTRTGVNTSLKDATKDAERLRTGLLPEDGTDYAAELDSIARKLEAVKADWTRRRAAIVETKSDARLELTNKSVALKAKVQTDLEAAIQKLRDEAAVKVTKIDEQLSGILKKTDEEADTAATEMETELKPQGEKLTAELATAKAKSEEYIRSKANRQHFEDKKKDVERYRLESENLTGQLEGLDELRKSLLKSFPIKGMEFPDGKIVYKGTPLRSMSSGEQIKLGIQVAALSAGEGGPIIVDDLEKLDPDNLKAFYRIASDTPYQFFFTRVGSGPLKVESLA